MPGAEVRGECRAGRPRRLQPLGEAARPLGRSLTWPPRGLGTSRLPELPPVPGLFPPLLLVWDEITVSALRECTMRRSPDGISVCVRGRTVGSTIDLKFQSSVFLANLTFFGRP